MDPISAIYLGVAYAASSVIQNLFWFLLRLATPRIYRHVINNPSMVSLLKAKLTGWHVDKVDGGRPAGVIIGRWYIADVSDKTITIWCSNKFLDDCQPPAPNTRSLTYYGDYGSCYTVKRVIISPRGDQIKALKVISRMSAEYKNGVYLLWGPPGCGKTKIAELLAQNYNLGIHIMTSIPNNDKIYYDRVLLINEVDDILDVIVGKASEKTRPGCTKAAWNNFIDFANDSANLIVILTTNVDPHVYDDYDSSLLRPSRVRARIHLRKKL